jgi:hypothetical protein
MTRHAGCLLVALLASGCGEDQANWPFLAGAWRFHNADRSFIEVFERVPPNPFGSVDQHGSQYVFDDPVGIEPSQRAFQESFLLTNHFLSYGGRCFGACSHAARIDRVGDEQMIIDYPKEVRPAELGVVTTYTRAHDIELQPPTSPRTVVKKR